MCPAVFTRSIFWISWFKFMKNQIICCTIPISSKAENVCFEGMDFGPFPLSSAEDCFTGSVLGIHDGFYPQELQHPTVDSCNDLAPSCVCSLPVHIAQSLVSDLEKQRKEMDWFLQLESRKLRRAIMEEGRRQQAMIIQKYESTLRSLMLQKNQELAVARNKARELEGLLNEAEMETRVWELRVREKEAIVSDLNTKLSQASPFFPNAPQEEDAVSFCGSSSGGKRGDGHRSNMMACKLCQAGSLCVVFFPCRHLCCCKACESLLGHCPVCTTVKEACLEVSLV